MPEIELKSIVTRSKDLNIVIYVEGYLNCLPFDNGKWKCNRDKCPTKTSMATFDLVTSCLTVREHHAISLADTVLGPMTTKKIQNLQNGRYEYNPTSKNTPKGFSTNPITKNKQHVQKSIDDCQLDIK